MYEPVRWGVPVREDTVLSRWHSEVGWSVPFLAAFSSVSVATWYPFTIKWTMSEHPNYGLIVRLERAMFRTVVKCSSHLATRPYETVANSKCRHPTQKQYNEWEHDAIANVVHCELRKTNGIAIS